MFDSSETRDWRQSLIGQSEPIEELCSLIRLVAPRRCTVLIGGETGSGKEVVARAIHAASNRASGPMVSVNCTALPENLIEAELFGHIKGAFTGASANRIGRFEQAHRGTIFLDEVGDLPFDSQAKLLRILQEQEFERLGSSETVRVDVRVLAASNVDLLAASRERKFREDLYYRLNVFPLQVPPLRERRDDIALLVEHFVEKIKLAEGADLKRVSLDAMAYLQARDWPGNVRQLEHAVQMAFVLSGDESILTIDHFQPKKAGPRRNPDASAPTVIVNQDGLNFEEVTANFERSLLHQALTLSRGNKARAADLLQMKRTTLLAKLKALGEPSTSDDLLALRAGLAVVPKRSTVLLCESDDAVLKLIARSLSAAGFRVLEAQDSSTAIELMQCWSDHVLSVVTSSGQLIERFRETRPGLPAVWITNRDQIDDARTRQLAKPFSAAELVEAVRTVSEAVETGAIQLCA